jgi:hypothetical protein
MDLLDFGTGWWVVRFIPPRRFTPGERTPGTYCTGGSVDPGAQPVAYQLSYPGS